MVAERQQQVKEERRRQAETDRGQLAQTLEKKAEKQAAAQLAVSEVQLLLACSFLWLLLLLL